MVLRRAVWTGIAAVLVLAAALSVGVGGLDTHHATPRQDLQLLAYPELGVMAGGPRDQYTYVWAAGALESTRMYATEALVLRVVRRPADKHAALELARRLGITVTSEDIKRLPDTQQTRGLPGTYRCSLEERNVEDQRSFDCKDVELWGNGCFNFWHRAGTPDPGFPDGLWKVDALSPERTRGIADRFTIDSGLLPEGCVFERVRAAVTQNAEGIEIYSAADALPRILSRQVVYTRRVEGIGLGSFTVDVNGRGEVYRVARRIPDVVPLARYPILSPDEARRMIPQGLLASHIWGPATAVIEHVSLNYSHAWPYSDTIQPIYSFSGTAYGQGGGTDPFGVGWPAVRPEYLLSDLDA